MIWSGREPSKAAGERLVRKFPCPITLGGSAVQSVAGALEAVKDSPVLTVTDDEIEPSARGIIHFVIVDNRVRFVIDDGAATRSGLSMSSKLLSLAVDVRRRRGL